MAARPRAAYARQAHQKGALGDAGDMNGLALGVFSLHHLMVIKVLAALARIVLSNHYAAIAPGNERRSPLSS